MKHLLPPLLWLGLAMTTLHARPLEKWDPTPLGPALQPQSFPEPPLRRPLQPSLKSYPTTGTPLTLVRDGKPAALLILPKRPSEAESEAAQLLAQTWEAISGASLPIISEEKVILDNHPSGAPRFLVDEVEWSAALWIGATQRAEQFGYTAQELPSEGFLIRSGDGEAFLIGNDLPVEGTRRPLPGTTFAASDLLERHFGVRWLWPGETGRVLKPATTLQLPALHEENAPTMTMRIIRGMSAGEPAMESHKAHFHLLRTEPEAHRTLTRLQGEWLRRQKTGYSVVENGNHAFEGWYERYGKEHPQWFALQPDGTRHQFPSRERLCVSNPELPAAVAREVDQKYRQNPNQPAGVAIAPNDGSGGNFFCMCEACRKLDPPAGRKYEFLFAKGPERKTTDRFYVGYPSLSDRYAHFYNRIAEETAKLQPEAKLVTLAYHVYSDAPLGIKSMHPSLTLGYVGGNYLSLKERENTRNQWNGWATRTQRLFWRPNVLHTGGGLPFFYGRRLAADLRHYYQSGMVGVDFDSLIGDWATQGLNYYLLAKVIWDPSIDVEEVIDDYCQAGFGPAAGEIIAYFNALEKLTDDYAVAHDRITAATLAEELMAEEREDGQPATRQKIPPLVTTFCEIFTSQRIDHLAALLEAARKKAATDATILARIDFLSTSVDLLRARQPFMETMAAGVYGRSRETIPLREDLLRYYRTIFAKDPQAINAVWAVRRDYYYLQDILVHED